MLALCIFALASLAIQVTARIEPGTKSILEYADYGVCAIFFADFVFSLWRAENRWRYLTTWGWLDLVSSIPMLDAARWGRLARIARVFRVLRGLRAAKLLTSAILKHRAENSFLAVSLTAILLIVFCSIAVLQFESTAESNIKTPEDAIWWSVTTMTTVGYGDRYPVTSEGRVVAVILMCSGVGLFGAFSAFLAAWLIAAPEDEQFQSLHREIALLRAAVEELSQRQNGRSQEVRGEGSGAAPE